MLGNFMLISSLNKYNSHKFIFDFDSLTFYHPAADKEDHTNAYKTGVIHYKM
jgi:hypothetical protein